MGVAFGFQADCGFDDVIDGSVGDAASDPTGVHFFEGAFPDFFVVGNHEMLGQPGPHFPIDPITEVAWTGGSLLAPFDGFEVALQTVEASLWCESADAVFEGVGNITVVPEDAGLPLGLDEVLPADPVLHPIEDFLFFGKENVAAGLIAGEIPDLAGAAKASRRFSSFKDGHLMLVLVEEAGEGQTGDTGTENGDLQSGLQKRERVFPLRGRRGRGEYLFFLGSIA